MHTPGSLRSCDAVCRGAAGAAGRPRGCSWSQVRQCLGKHACNSPGCWWPLPSCPTSCCPPSGRLAASPVSGCTAARYSCMLHGLRLWPPSCSPPTFQPSARACRHSQGRRPCCSSPSPSLSSGRWTGKAWERSASSSRTARALQLRQQPGGRRLPTQQQQQLAWSCRPRLWQWPARHSCQPRQHWPVLEYSSKGRRQQQQQHRGS